MAHELLQILPFALFLPFFVLMWCTACGALSQLGGWASLATRYRTSQPRPKQRCSASARLGMVSYRGMLVVGWSEAGLHLSVWLPWRLFHPPLLIPWRAINRRTMRGFGPFKREVIELEGGEHAMIALAPGVTKEFEARLPPMAA